MTRPPVTSLYLHVPFCARKCAYCAFYSEAGDAALIQDFTGALIREIEMVAGDLQPQTVFFGGGTPSLLSLKQWTAVLETFARQRWQPAEFTIECNPATVSLDKARLWKSHGVNRVSMGAQSFDEQLLDRLGRVHSREMVFKSFDILRQAGFDNLNLDLMFAIPGQTEATWEKTLDEALALQSEHLACYEVIYEEDTPLFHQLQAGEFSVDEELACRMYDTLVERCQEAGLRQYEIANFARPVGAAPSSDIPERACRHNINYWRGGSFYGLGPSASGFVDGVRTKNVANTRIYCDRIVAGGRAIETEDRLPTRARAGEIAAFGLRMNSGWRWQEFRERTGFDLAAEFQEGIERLQREGLGVRHPEGFRLNQRGLRFADYAAEQFIS